MSDFLWGIMLYPVSTSALVVFACICQVIVTWHKSPKQFVLHCNPIESTWFQELATHNTCLTTVAGEGYRIPRLLVLPHMSECLVSHSGRLCFLSPGTSSREEERLPWIRTKGDALSRSQGPALGHRRFFEGRILGFIKELLARLYHIYTCYVVYKIHRRHRFSYVWGTLWITESKTLDEPLSWYERYYIPRDRGIMGISYQLSQSFLMDYPSVTSPYNDKI